MCRAQRPLALGCSAMGTKSRIAPGMLKAVGCKGAWRAVLPAVKRKIRNTRPDFPLDLPALHPLAGLGRGAAGAVAVCTTAFLMQQ